MTLPRSVAEILHDHVTLEVEGIDRMYLNAVVPLLQSERGIAWFFRKYRGYAFASSALMAPMTRAFVESLEGFTRSYDRLLRPGLAAILPDGPPTGSTLRASFRQLEVAMTSWAKQAKLAS